MMGHIPSLDILSKTGPKGHAQRKYQGEKGDTQQLTIIIIIVYIQSQTNLLILYSQSQFLL